MKATATRGDHSTAIAKAAMLVEALPWLERFHGKTVVVKYGGNAMTDRSLMAAFVQDVVFLHYAGLRPVVVHGGGPQISEHLDRLGIETTFAGGLRVTTPQAMDVVRMVLVGQVQREIVNLVNDHGPFAVGMSGEDANLFTAVKRTTLVNGERVDLGMVGEIESVSPAAVQALLADGRIPVVSSIGMGADRAVYNLNADSAAAALAVALRAEKLIVLTNVPGLIANWPTDDTVISRVAASDVAALLPDLDAGMAPKMEACLHAVRGGVPAAHLIDGRIPHALLVEVITDEGIGTMVVA